MSIFELEREQMVRVQLERRGIRDERVLAAMRSVARELFVPPDQQAFAYDDGPIAIGYGQTISQPYIVALMSELLELRGDEVVLEVGAGSGYQAAVLAQLAKTVHAVERLPELATICARRLQALGYSQVFVHEADGSLGWPSAAPYGGILVTAAAPEPPPPLLAQLAEGARLVLPVGGRSVQELQVWQRQGDRFAYRSVLPVAFVPLRGRYGWA